MNFADSDRGLPSVKLFPRLAVTTPQLELKRSRRRLARHRRLAAEDDRPEATRSQVRARLFHMIVENERVRRHEQRPSAS